jgi:hypothetical protein
MLPKPVKQKKKRRAFQKSSSKSAAMKRADDAFSYFIRQRDANEAGVASCISCGQMFHWVAITNGHWIGRSNQRLRFDEENCAAQCRTCNTIACGKSNRIFLYGGLRRAGRTKMKDVKRKHTEGLVARHGEEILDQIRERGRELQKTSIEHYDEITRKYREKCEENGWQVG